MPYNPINKKYARCGRQIVRLEEMGWAHDCGYGESGNLCLSCSLEVDSMKKRKNEEEYDKAHGYF